MKQIVFLIVVIFCASLVQGQVTSQRVIYTAANPPTSCTPGKLYTNKTTHKVYLGSSVGGCTDVTGGGSSPSGSITASGYTMNTAKLLGRNTASAGAIEEITLGTNLSLSGTTLNAAGSSPTIGDTQVAFGNGANVIGGDSGLTYNKTTDTLSVTGSVVTPLIVGDSATPNLALSTGSGTSLNYGDDGILIGDGVVYFKTQGSLHWVVNSIGGFIAQSDNATDIGASGTSRPRTGYFGTSVNSPSYLTTTNCADSAGAAACGSAAAGSVVIDAGSTSVVVSTTAVTANSEITLTEDSSLGTRLGITCNTSIVRLYAVTARTAGTSFTITTSAAPVTNAACLNYKITN